MAQISEVSICNQGLGWLGASLITSFDDNSDESNLCRANYCLLRDAVLEAADWSFAVKRVQLSALASPTLGYGQAYQVPEDCLRVIQASPNDDFSHVTDMQWEFEDRKILTDEGAVFIRYVHRQIDPVRYSPGFVNALAYRIATELAIPLTRRLNLQGQMLGLYEKSLGEAMGSDGKQGRSRRVRSSWSHKSRRGSTIA